ncbi:MAG: VCBS repeat-containing protein [Phycisphaerae bacterium]|nr:VCBS repeat-containing protein [Phycisphaerae bacterium]
MNTRLGLLLSVVAVSALGAMSLGQVTWTLVSGPESGLVGVNAGSQQTACLVLDIDKDGIDDIVVTERTQAPSVVWYKYRGDRKWDRFVIEDRPLHIEAGGDSYDIDGDGDLDITFCGDSRDDGAWWWENPYPVYDAAVPWRRRLIKSGDNARYQHDSRFGDFDGDGQVELAWWSQTARKLFLAQIPAKPREALRWRYEAIFTYLGGAGHEGMDVADVNLDGRRDIVGAGYWFEYSDGRFVPHRIADRPNTRIKATQLIAGGRPEVVISPGDSDGPLEWYQWQGGKWVGRTLLKEVVHGHSLDVADINGDGHMDIFVGEMGNPGAGAKARTMVFWGDGKGGFTLQIVAVGLANHESRLGDVNGDGKLDIVGKPYNYGAPVLHVWLQD